MSAPFGWLSIIRIGLVQASLGAVVVMTTSTLNRVMVVEYALPAMLPGLLVALHYAAQIARPRMGHGSDLGRRRTPWIVGGMALLAAGGVGAALATTWMDTRFTWALSLAVVSFVAIGLGVSASGTSLLVLLAKRVDASRRAAAATVVWTMMIAGFALTAGVTGRLLDPYSPARLVMISAAVSLLALCVTLVATWRLEGPAGAVGPVSATAPAPAVSGQAQPRAAASFRAALSQVWGEPLARRFTVFVFVSMLAYSMQDLILEPFAGTVFGFTPGQSTSLSGLQHSGVLLGMVAAVLAGKGSNGRRFGSLAAWQIGGCLVSALMLSGLVAAAFIAGAWPFKATVFALGAANGAFSIAAIAAMMQHASQGGDAREGTRMGLWGAAQAIAFGLGGFTGALASDVARWVFGDPVLAYAAVFAIESVLFVAAGCLAWRMQAPPRSTLPTLQPAAVAPTQALRALQAR